MLIFLHNFAIVNQISVHDVPASHSSQYPSLTAPHSFVPFDLDVLTVNAYIETCCKQNPSASSAHAIYSPASHFPQLAPIKSPRQSLAWMSQRSWWRQ